MCNSKICLIAEAPSSPFSISFSFPYSFSSVFDCLARTTSIWLPPLHTPILRGFDSSCHRRPRNGSWNALVLGCRDGRLEDSGLI